MTPSLLTYFSGGYTEATFDRLDFTFFGQTRPSDFINKQTYHGYFIGAGDEYALSFVPGLFWKTEYRFSDLDNKTNAIRVIATGLPGTFADDSHKFVHTVRSELVYRFNWGGPLVAKY